jgi:hypothetical protein
VAVQGRRVDGLHSLPGGGPMTAASAPSPAGSTMTTLTTQRQVADRRGPQCQAWDLKKQKSSPSAFTPLGEVFPECAIFGSRGRWLHRETIPRTLFPKSCTWGRLPRVQLVRPQVQRAPGEDPGSRSDVMGMFHYLVNSWIQEVVIASIFN